MHQEIDKIFQRHGTLSLGISQYEPRESQRQMALQVASAYLDNSICLIEAATGVGKSWAYLIPALLFAAKTKELTLISTHTIALQEQLIHKDIPFLLELFNLDLEATLVKGMSNYFCYRKFEELLSDLDLLPSLEMEEIVKIESWVQYALEGSRSEIPFAVSPSTWDEICAERGTCSHQQCPHFKKCFFFKARKKLGESQILVANHHLVVAEMALQMRSDFGEEKAIFPKVNRVILDEAHHLEEIALESFSSRIERLDLSRFLGRIYSEFHPQKSRLFLFLADLSKKKPLIPPQLSLLFQTEIPFQKKQTLEALEDLFDKIELLIDQILSKGPSDFNQGRRHRFSQIHTTHSFWKELKLEETFDCFKEELIRLFFLIQELKKQSLEGLSDEDKEPLQIHITILDFISEYLNQKLELFELFLFNHEETSRVRWIESTIKTPSNFILVDAKLDISQLLTKYFFSSKQTAILCSATLKSGKDFSFLKEQLGLKEPSLALRTQERHFDSPFDFEKNSLFFVPKDFPEPQDPNFHLHVVSFLNQIIDTTDGGCFILFTSYDLLEFCYNHIDRKEHLSYLKQGTLSKKVLIDQFKKNTNSILFGTSSFWEGIDVPGNALRCVIITKLPFKVPTTPLVQAIKESYQKEGKDSFSEYFLPKAALQFKQGFGRLIRTQHDRGCVICLDNRVMTKSYGKLFLQALPACPALFEEKKRILEKMRQFFYGD